MVFLSHHNSVTNRAREFFFFFKLKLIYELYWAGHISRHLAPIVSLENRYEHFALLLAEIGPGNIIYMYLCFKKRFGKLDNGLY